MGSAVDKAYWRAARSLFYFERFENHTIFHPSEAKFGKTKVEIAPLPSGYGLRTSRTVRRLRSCCGRSAPALSALGVLRAVPA